MHTSNNFIGINVYNAKAFQIHMDEYFVFQASGEGFVNHELITDFMLSVAELEQYPDTNVRTYIALFNITFAEMANSFCSHKSHKSF